MSALTNNDVTKNLKDAAYVIIGLGVVGYQRAQAQSEELAKRLATQRKQFDAQVDEARAQITKLAGEAQKRIEPVRDQVRGQVEGQLNTLRARFNAA